ncbi:hypothetical protein HS99_0003295 [Kitasatospora aureofaciens]|uniref:Uncharacterized protein n=1 Tax=Kitasatospora aureofaciens TaxID=1894 RepID=A0A1E7NG57_KITAU|nr:hypothetical protein HS99_0003295 [Kitasatospora aureofaciens]
MPETPKSPRRIADDHVVRVAALDPATSTRLGLHPEDDRQPDLSPDGFEALAEVARQTLTALDTTALVDDPAELDCARLLRERLTAELAVHEAGDHYRQLRNVNSPLHKVRGVFTMMPTDTAEQWAAVAGRLRNVPGALHGYRATLAEGIGRGLLSAPGRPAPPSPNWTPGRGERAAARAGSPASSRTGPPRCAPNWTPPPNGRPPPLPPSATGSPTPTCPPPTAPRTPSAASTTCAAHARRGSR